MCERNHLKAIKGLCGEGNAPDMKDWVYVAYMSDVKEFPNMDSNTWRIGNDLVMTAPVGAIPAGRFEKWQVSKTDSGYMGGKKDDHFEPKFEFFIEKLDEIKTFILAKARGERLVVIATDNNGKPRLMREAELMFDEQTKGKNGYKIDFSCGKIPDPLPYYMGKVQL